MLFLILTAWLASVAGLQTGFTPAPTMAYTVAYLEVSASGRAATVAALKAYRRASVGEEGAGSIEVFEQVARSGHFLVVESWRGDSALAAHRSGPAAARLHGLLQPLELGDVDERSYKPLSVGASAPVSSQTIYVITHVDTAPTPGADPAGLLLPHAEASRHDAGNLRFDVLQHTMRANHFTVIEAWRDERALNAHAAAAHTIQYRRALQPLAGSPLDERLYRAVE